MLFYMWKVQWLTLQIKLLLNKIIFMRSNLDNLNGCCNTMIKNAWIKI